MYIYVCVRAEKTESKAGCFLERSGAARRRGEFTSKVLPFAK
jgi:hypothetical protein